MPGWYGVTLMWCPRCAVEWNGAEETTKCPECGREGRHGIDMSTAQSRAGAPGHPADVPEGETWRL